MSVVYRFRHTTTGRQHQIPVSGASITVGDLEREIKDAKLGSLHDKGGRRADEATLLFYDADTGEEYAGDAVEIPVNARVVVHLITIWSTAFRESRRAAEFRRIAAEYQSKRGEKAAEVCGAATPTPSRSRCSYWRYLKTPPGYVCRRCGVPGHFIQACPTNDDPRFDDRGGGAPSTHTGGFASWSLSPPAASDWRGEKAVECKKADSPSAYSGKSRDQLIPAELLCPLCKQVMKDAVLTKCCFRSFCDTCIRDRLVSISVCDCGAGAAPADRALIPNKTLRETIARTLASAMNGGRSSSRCVEGGSARSGSDRSTVTQEDTGGSGGEPREATSRVARHRLHQYCLGKRTAAPEEKAGGGGVAPKKLRSW